ncbi:MAG: hypothetical protein DSY46_06735 [Hydrogenimonas sp.]|nr:MAG: hypothetical protein DSY46_06735 [Hydrogenimonas sp.]
MIAKVYASQKNSLLLCMEELYEKIKHTIKEADFYLFSIHPSFPPEEVNPTIQRIFQTDQYAAFHALNAFKDDQIHDQGVVMCCIKFQKRGRVTTFYLEDIRQNPEHSAKTCTHYLQEHNHAFHIILAGLAEGTFGNFLEFLSKNLDHGASKHIVGGISSGPSQNGELHTFQFTAGKIIKNGLMIISLENVEAETEISLGFKPYGITYEIKRANGYKLYSVDEGENFAQIARRMLHGIDNPDVRYLWYAPLYILDETDGHVATIRTIDHIGKDYVKLFGAIHKGEHFKLSFATHEDLLKEDHKAALQLKQKIHTPELAFNFSCIARQYALEEHQTQEPKIYTQTLNTHLFGFFTYGEIGPDKKYQKLKLYNETSLLVAMREI